MQIIYTFTPDELRMVQAIQSKLQQTFQFIMDLHQLQGPLTIDPEGKGFVQPPTQA
jgi:hypothetical protein